MSLSPRPRFAAGTALLITTLLAGPGAWAAEQDIKPTCETGWSPNKDGNCMPAEALQAKLNGNQAMCASAGGTFQSATPNTCAVVAQTPRCPGGPQVRYSSATKTCVVDTTVNPPARTNYVSDCLKLTTPLKGVPPHVTHIRVLSQTEDGTELSAVAAPQSPFYSCSAPDMDSAGQLPTRLTVRVEDVVASGALRRGYTYGTLVVPFKYYMGAKELAPSATIAPYFGRRIEALGGSASFIVAAGVGVVSGSSKDAGGNAQTEQLTAFSTAWGLTFETRKPNSQNGRGLQSGILVGRDYVGRAHRAAFDQHGKTWVSVQIGYDFTDY
ncbi:hypothetical protein [Ideonella livida]|uniref:Uncharacterized protein n=1 Tax=Ideonella livida TaxID=2707176 RepID=A0A7C9TN88_9BURK|nr:hypothetical protein [Ideonella livida]NDY93007.1 hypothetical protein [Ideonella livida]